MVRLTPEQWRAIRIVWEYDPDEPSYREAAERAAEKYEFLAPKKQTIADRAKAEGWTRRGARSGLAAAAHWKADAKMGPGGAHLPSDGDRPEQKPDGFSASKPDAARTAADVGVANSARDAHEDMRAEINVRHRHEWKNIALLRNEALVLRQTDPVRCSERLRQTKLAAEITALQQAGERKAWGMELMLEPGDLEKLSDEALAAIAKGRVPRGMA